MAEWKNSGTSGGALKGDKSTSVWDLSMPWRLTLVVLALAVALGVLWEWHYFSLKEHLVQTTTKLEQGMTRLQGHGAVLKTAVVGLHEKVDALHQEGSLAQFDKTIWESLHAAATAEEELPVTAMQAKAAHPILWGLFCTASLVCLVAPLLAIHYVDDIWLLCCHLCHLVSGQPPSGKVAIPLSKRIAYRLDYWLSVDSRLKPLALLAFTLWLIVVGGVSLYWVEDIGLTEATWQAWGFVVDTGGHADLKGFAERIVGMAVSVGGMLVFALMLGLVSEAISEKVDSMRKGRSEVLEEEHTLILGWNDKLGSLLKHLAIANESMGGSTVVILADLPKEDMEADIVKMGVNLRGTAVICRSGSPVVQADLKKVSVSTARAVVVLADEGDPDQSDARALRIVLGLTGVQGSLHGHIVVELCDIDNRHLLRLVGGDRVETVVAHDVIGRLMIHCARQPGLAQVWEDLLGFEHNEFYIKEWPELTGCTFGEVLLRFPDAVPCGVKVAAEHGRIQLNPPDEYRLQEGDKLLVIAEDDDSYSLSPVPEGLGTGLIPKSELPPPLPERILFCGWRRDVDDMIAVVDSILRKGSEVWLFNETPLEERAARLREGGLDPDHLKHVRLVHVKGNSVVRRHLEALPLETFDSVLILAEEKMEGTVGRSDQRSLATLLLIRDIQSKRMPTDVTLREKLAEERRTQKLEMLERGPSFGPAPAFDFGRSIGLATQGIEGEGIELWTGTTPVRSHTNHKASWVSDMQEVSGHSIVISEILDSGTRGLVSVANISDYVLSNELVSMALAMVAEDAQVNHVLSELFTEEGNEIYIRPAAIFLDEGEELNFYELQLRARQRNEILIGYRRPQDRSPELNPSNKLQRHKWTLHDSFVCIAFDQ